MTAIERFKKEFFVNHEGAVLILSEVNRFYFTGFESSEGAVLITSDSSYLIIDFRYYEMAKATVTEFNVVLAEKSLIAIAHTLIKEENINNIYIEDDYVTVGIEKRLRSIFEQYSIDYLGDYISKMRAVKTTEEIKRITNAQSLTDAAFAHILGYLRKGITEKDVAAELDFFMRKNGAQGSAFKTITVSGKNSSLPHGEPTNALLTENSFLTMDFGAKLDGYCADMTRTVVIGRADQEMRRIYDIVLVAQISALRVIRANILGNEVDRAARSIITEAGYGKNFGHATGHGLGIEVHEAPSFSPNYNSAIPENAVLSVEPGIYLENKYGVRIEDIVVVGKESAIDLTQSEKKLIEI